MAPDIMVARAMARSGPPPLIFPCHATGHGLCSDTLTHPRFITKNEKGRKIACAFTCLQRIGKNPSIDFWLPPTTRNDLEPSLRNKTAPSLNPFQIEWAEIRQFDLLQEAGNLAVYDLEVDEFTRAHNYLMKMRAGGYRLSIITVGSYTENEKKDEQNELDTRLSQEIGQLIHMLYLAKPSVVLTDQHQRELAQNTWSLETSLPHVAMAFGERALFERERSPQTALSGQFVSILNQLQQKNIGHDVAIGLTIPDHHKSHQQAYICKREEQFHVFQTTLTTVFESSNWISLSGLQKGIATGRDELAVMRHMRGYGDHTSYPTATQNRTLATHLSTPSAWAA